MRVRCCVSCYGPEELWFGVWHSGFSSVQDDLSDATIVTSTRMRYETARRELRGSWPARRLKSHPPPGLLIYQASGSNAKPMARRRPSARPWTVANREGRPPQVQEAMGSTPGLWAHNLTTTQKCETVPRRARI